MAAKNNGVLEEVCPFPEEELNNIFPLNEIMALLEKRGFKLKGNTCVQGIGKGKDSLNIRIESKKHRGKPFISFVFFSGKLC